MKNLVIIPLIVGTVMALSTPVLAASEEAREKTVALSSVPQPAIEAARQALGTKPTLAKIVTGSKPRQYELLAKDDSDQRIGVHVRADGTVTGKKEYKE
jgi:hypothetical protein